MSHLAAQLEKFNPVNIIQGGSHKIEHPVENHSNAISHNVEDMHRDFGVMHKNLKNLVMLYKTRHQLMESMNENGLYTAKCYREMLEGTPLAGIVSSERKHKEKSDALVPVDPESSAKKSLQAHIEGDDIDTSEYPESGVIREKVDPDEGSRIGKDLSRDHSVEPEGLKASKLMSVNASDTSHLATIEDAVGDDDKKHDPPSAASIAAGKYDRKEIEDPPSSKPFPDDEASEISGDKNKDHSTANSGSVNVIVDDEDSFTGGEPVQEKAPASGEEEVKEATPDDEKHSLVEKIVEDANDAVDKVKDLVLGKKKDEKVEDDVGKEGDSEERASSPVQSSDGGDIAMADVDLDDAGSNSDLEAGEKDDAEYLNISNDGALMVMKDEPNSEPAPTASDFHPYYDVHKAAYKETSAKLAEEHKSLVRYVEKWESVVATRVQSRYDEYARMRKGLNHYAKKVTALQHEEERLHEKHRPMKPKQMEKLERNKVKLQGTQKVHDRKGEELVMLMEEVTLRAWRDAFPLLKKTVGFEVDFAAIQQKHMSNLAGCSERLQAMEEKETIPVDGRLKQLQNFDIEELYTGSRVKQSSGKVDA